MRLSTTLVFLFAITLVGNAQEKKAFFSNIHYQTEAGAYLSTSGQNAFWLRSNQYGTVPLESQIATLRAGLWKDYTPKLKKNNDTSSNQTSNILHQTSKFTYGYGLQAVANVGKANQILIPEAYFKMRYGAFEIYAGRRREIFGLVDTTLSSGSYIWSGNALPMPKVQISIPEYTSIIGHGLISIKGNYAHGWFGRQTYAQNYYLHQKSLYGRIGKPNWRVKMYGGFNHQVQWGGYVPSLINNAYASQNGYLASGFNTMMNIAFPFGFTKKIFPPKNPLGYDEDNHGGNQLGSVDFAGEITLNKMTILAYRQLPYELGSLFSSLVNADDGLYGISLKLNKPLFHTIKKITIEGFHSFNQGMYRSGAARLFNLQDRHFSEYHNYFNHGQYQDGWSYNNIGIGTPFIMNDIELNKPTNTGNYSSFNQVKAIYFALLGNISNFSYGLKTNYSLIKKTGGHIINNYPIHQSSIIIFGSYQTANNYHINLFISTDFGELLKNQTGVNISISKKWN